MALFLKKFKLDKTHTHTQNQFYWHGSLKRAFYLY